MAAVPEPHVLIIGAGVTGLLIAHGLHEAGVKHTIFESEDPARFRPKEWTMGIHWGLPLLEQLLPPDLAARISTDASVDGSLDYRSPPYNGSYIYDGVTGEILKDLTSANDGIMRVSRRKLRALCREQVAVNYNHTLENIQWSVDQKTVTVTFTNGTRATGTLLVGADGPRSIVRDALFSPDVDAVQAQPIEDVVTISMAMSYADAEIARKVRAAHPVWCMCIHPDIFPFLSMQEVPDPDRPETWRFYMVLSWRGYKDDGLDNAGRLKEIKRRGDKLAEPFRTAIMSVPDDTDAPYVELVYWIARPWDTRNGLITLAGDSAHPMPPFRGQGGNHAIQDAHNFVEAVKKIKAEEAWGTEMQENLMKQYSDEVAKRGSEETQLSLKNGRMMISYTDFKESPYMKQGLSRGGSRP